MSNWTPTFQTEPVQFCGVDCFVREWSAADREEFENLAQSRPINKIRACYLVGSLVDADGKKLFTIDQLEEISNMPFFEVLKVVKIVEKLNRLNVSIEQLEKN